MADICNDNRFEVIARAKKDLLEGTNIETDKDEMKVIDNILFRCWQMGWLDRYNTADTPQTEEQFCIEHRCTHYYPQFGGCTNTGDCPHIKDEPQTDLSAEEFVEGMKNLKMEVKRTDCPWK